MLPGSRATAAIGITCSSSAAPFYQKIVFVSDFNARVEAIDVRDPYNPQDVAFFIPAFTQKTDYRWSLSGQPQRLLAESRRTMSPLTTADTSTSSTARTPGCTSFSSKPRQRRASKAGSNSLDEGGPGGLSIVAGPDSDATLVAVVAALTTA
jgi:hypothetical protein